MLLQLGTRRCATPRDQARPLHLHPQAAGGHGSAGQALPEASAYLCEQHARQLAASKGQEGTRKPKDAHASWLNATPGQGPKENEST